jgi:predicted nucleic acid-binding protein
MLLDACLVVNLFATRHVTVILTAASGPVAIVDAVAREAQYIFRGGDGDDARERERIDLSAVIAESLLDVIEVADEDELLTYIDLTQEVDDGEAMTAAVAIHRGYTVATDDRKAIRILQRHQVPLCTSLDLIKTWADRQSVSPDLLQTVLRDLRTRGNYAPSRNHPLRNWWDSALEIGSLDQNR